MSATANTRVPVNLDELFYAALVEDDPAELYDNAPCAYLSTLPDGLIVKVNRTFCTWTGHRRDELIGRRRFQELLAPGDRIFHETHVAPLLRMQGQVREIAVEVICASGRRLPVLVNSVLKPDETGGPLVVRTAMFDATERRSYERELLAARRRAEESEARARTLAQTLQSTFLPPAMPAVPGVDLGGAFRPAGDGSEVGGDFYDVFETGSGAWAVTIGDVCGKGAPAAVLTALARYTVRAESIRCDRPSEVLGGLHQALLRYQPDNCCTALYGELRRGDAGVRFTLASGGHHLPLRLGRDGTLAAIGRPGSILGILDEARLNDSTVTLVPGDVVVLYTDGVTEARQGTDFFDDEGLQAVLRDASDLDAQQLADHIVSAALEFQDGNARDDIAVVVIRVPEEAA